jgi:hypothetical protein
VGHAPIEMYVVVAGRKHSGKQMTILIAIAAGLKFKYLQRKNFSNEVHVTTQSDLPLHQK